MKNIKKPLISFLMAMVIIFCMVTPTSAASAYDAGKALSYAKAHWNDGKGYCAEFVSDCLKAGGCTVWSTGATTLAKRLKSSSYGTWLELEFEKNGNIKVSKNRDKLSLGDPVFYYCPQCEQKANTPYVHVVLYSGEDSNGNMKCYAHNSSKNNEVITLKGCGYSDIYYDGWDKHPYGRVTAAYVYHMNEATNSSKPSSTQPQYFDCNIQITCSPGKEVNLYNNPGDSNRAEYFSKGQSVVSTRGAKLSDGTTWYEITARKRNTGEIRNFWLKYDSSRMTLKNLSDGNSNSDTTEKDRNVKLALEKPIVEVSLGETATFNFTFTGDAGKVEYRILDKNICEYVSGGWKQSEHKGYITFSTLAEGTTNIPIFLYDKNENVADFYLATLTVKKAATSNSPQKATTLTFSPSSLALDLTNQKSQEVTLTLGGDFSWGDKLYRSVSNPDVASVDWSSYEGGSVFRPVITAKAAGDTTLTCSIEDNSTGKTLATAVLKITVTAATYTVQYDANGGKNAPASQTKQHNKELTLTSDCPKREGFTFAGWAASRNGSVQYQPGDSFTTDKDVTLYAIWEAKNQVSLTLANEAFTVKPGKQATLNFTFTGNISSVDYEIKDTSICEYVDGEWKQSQHRGTLIFRALSSGTTDITIKLFDKTGKVLDSQSASVTVETPQSNASIELSESNINFSSPGETQGISVVTVPGGQNIIWSKEIIESLPIPDWNPSVCSINGSANNEGARIRATGPGTAAVIASMTYEGNTYTAKCLVTVPGVYVSVPDTVIVKDGNRKTMNIGSTEQFSVYTIPSNQTVHWNSSDPSVATVSSNGTVTAVGSGFAEIRATIDVNGTTYSDSCYVAVPENSSNTGVVYFDTLYPFASDRYTGNEGDSFIDVIGRRNGNVDVNGNSYEHGLTAWVARWNYTAESSWVWNQYSLSGNYKTLTGKVVLIKSYNESNFDTQLTITGDGIPLYSKRLTPDSLPTEEFQINVAGINTLKIELSDNTSVRGGTAFGLANLSLQ